MKILNETDWSAKIGKQKSHDEHLGPYGDDFQRLKGGFITDGDEKHVTCLKLVKWSPHLNDDEPNYITDNYILVSLRADQDFNKFDKMLQQNIIDNIPIVTFYKNGHYVFAGLFQYDEEDKRGLAPHNLKYKLIPFVKRTDSAQELTQIQTTEPTQQTGMNARGTKRRAEEKDSDGDDLEFKQQLTKRSSSDQQSKKIMNKQFSIKPRMVSVNGISYGCVLEGRYALFLTKLSIPYVPQYDTKILLNTENFNTYKIDYLVFPDDPKRRFFIECKPFKPSINEELLCEQVASAHGIPVFLLYGNFGVPYSIGTDFPDGYSGIRFHLQDGRVVRDEGYAFMQRNNIFCMDKKMNASDTAFYTFELKDAYDYAIKHVF